MTVQLEFDALKSEIAKVKETSDQVRKGIFARYNEFTKTLEAKYSQLQNEIYEIKRIIEKE